MEAREPEVLSREQGRARAGGKEPLARPALTLFCFPEPFSRTWGQSLPVSSALMSATGTDEEDWADHWGPGGPGESGCPSPAPPSLRCSGRLSGMGGPATSSTSPYSRTLWLGDRQQNHSLSVRRKREREGVKTGALIPTQPLSAHPAHSITLAPPAADLAENCPLAEAEQTLLADQAHELWLQLLP